MSPLARRALHARLAARAADPDVRARHLALSTDEPDAAVAALLEEAAERARERGASDLAAEFARHSLRLTPPDDADAAPPPRARRDRAPRGRRRGRAARAELADAPRRGAAAGPAAARRRSSSAPTSRTTTVDDARRSCSARSTTRGTTTLLRGRVLDQLGWVRGTFRGDLAGGDRRARARRSSSPSAPATRAARRCTRPRARRPGGARGRHPART